MSLFSDNKVTRNTAGDACAEVYSCMKGSFPFETEGNEEESWQTGIQNMSVITNVRFAV